MDALLKAFYHCNVEAIVMRWHKRELLKAGIVVASALLFLVLMTLAPVSVTRAYEDVSELATPGTVTIAASPTEDATVTALNKEKLAQEVQQLKGQNEPDFLGWLRGNVSILLSTLVVVIGGLIGLLRYLAERRDSQKRLLEDRQAERERQDEEQKRWLKDQEAEREKRAEERFQAAVTGLGDDKEGARIGAAILLRTFLRPGYEQFYTQTFDLATANLRQPFGFIPPERPIPLTPLCQALIVVFKEAFPLARSQNTRSPQSLDATNIQLDLAYLRQADLQQVWMPQASLQYAGLGHANLREANLAQADLSRADLVDVDLSGANLVGANLSGANLADAKLNEAALVSANLSQADLRRANLSGCLLMDAELSNSFLWRADLSQADLRRADLSNVDIEEILSFTNTDLRGVKGLTQEQLAACKAKGAIVDEDSTTSSSQPTAATPPPEPRNNVQASSTPSAQGSLPTSNVSESSAVSSKPGSGS